MKIVALVKVNKQVSPTDGQFFTESKSLDGSESIEQIVEWAEKRVGKYLPINIRIVVEKDS